MRSFIFKIKNFFTIYGGVYFGRKFFLFLKIVLLSTTHSPNLFLILNNGLKLPILKQFPHITVRTKQPICLSQNNISQLFNKSKVVPSTCSKPHTSIFSNKFCSHYFPPKNQYLGFSSFFSSLQ